MPETKLKLTNRGWAVVTTLGTIGFVGIIVMSGWLEAAL